MEAAITGEVDVPTGAKNWPAFASRATGLLASPELRVLGGVAVYSFLAILFLRDFRISDPDIWWHIRTGQWIFDHQSVPRTDMFSLYAKGQTWVAYSWMFEVLAALLFRHFSFNGIVFYELTVRLLLAVALFRLVHDLLPKFWRAAGLALLGLYALSYVIGPRPGMITILFVILELHILLSAQRTGRAGRLWFLPALFALWANWHVQFVYGLFVLGVFACEPLLNALLRYHPKQGKPLPAARLWVCLGVSAVATLANPYGAKVYGVIFDFVAERSLFDQIVELMAPTFREPQHFTMLLLVLGAAFALGWRRDARPLWLILLACSAFLAFRSVREIWFAVVVSLGMIADWPAAQRPSPRTTERQRLAIAVLVLAVVVGAYRRYGVSNDFLEMAVAGKFPEAASRYIEMHDLPGPLYNHFDWGGFLIWRLPQLPVAMDGRGNLYPADRVARFTSTWKGAPDWAADPDLRQANLVIAQRKAPLAALLAQDTDFENVYQDVQAVVFRRRQR